MSIFVDDTPLEGEVFYIIAQTKSGRERPLPITTDIERERFKDRLKSFKVYFRPQNYESFNQMMRDSIVIQPDGNLILHPTAIREAQIKSLLIKWTLEDEEGNAIPLNAVMLDNLYPDIANAIMDEYLRLSSANMEIADDSFNVDDLMNSDDASDILKGLSDRQDNTIENEPG